MASNLEPSLSKLDSKPSTLSSSASTLASRAVTLVSRVVTNGKHSLRAEFTSRQSDRTWTWGADDWRRASLQSAYIPVKEMLANAPGFLSLYEQREVHFEETYRDILLRAFVPPERGRPPKDRERLLRILSKAISGRVTSKNEEFYLRNRDGNLEFSLLAEGFRKLGLLWLMISNGTLLKGSVLFWDEPETNLNPALYGPVVKVLLELQRSGVQIFVATHDYVILKEIDLQMEPADRVQFHSLHKDRGRIVKSSASSRPRPKPVEPWSGCLGVHNDVLMFHRVLSYSRCRRRKPRFRLASSILTRNGGTPRPWKRPHSTSTPSRSWS